MSICEGLGGLFGKTLKQFRASLIFETRAEKKEVESVIRHTSQISTGLSRFSSESDTKLRCQGAETKSDSVVQVSGL